MLVANLNFKQLANSTLDCIIANDVLLGL